MELLDFFRVGLRWIHALAAVLWIGGSLFFWLVLRPSLQDLADPSVRGLLMTSIAKEFQSLVQVAIGMLVLSGVLIGYDRLSQSDIVSGWYAGVLAVKVSIAIVMFWLAFDLARRRPTPAPPPTRLAPQTVILTLGLLVYLLADVLKVLFEHGLRMA